MRAPGTSASHGRRGVTEALRSHAQTDLGAERLSRCAGTPEVGPVDLTNGVRSPAGLRVGLPSRANQLAQALLVLLPSTCFSGAPHRLRSDPEQLEAGFDSFNNDGCARLTQPPIAS